MREYFTFLHCILLLIVSGDIIYTITCLKLHREKEMLILEKKFMYILRIYIPSKDFLDIIDIQKNSKQITYHNIFADISFFYITFYLLLSAVIYTVTCLKLRREKKGADIKLQKSLATIYI